MESNKKFVKKGNVLVLKEEVADRELTSKDVLANIGQLESMLNQAVEDIDKREKEIEHIKGEMERLQPLLGEIEKHKKWAVEVQESKARVFVDSLLEPLTKEVNDEFKEDPALTPEQVIASKMVALQNKIGRDKEVADELSPEMIRKSIYTECIFDNPWR